MQHMRRAVLTKTGRKCGCVAVCVRACVCECECVCVCVYSEIALNV